MANTKYKIILFLIAILFFSNCDYTSKKDEILLSEAESIINVHPDSALIILDSIYFPEQLKKNLFYRYVLLETQAKDRTKKNIVQDTLIFEAKQYFEKQGDMHRLALSTFYSGRVLYERKNSQKALSEYLKADEYASELENENTLIALINANMGHVYYDQLLFDDAKRHFRKADQYLDIETDTRNKALINSHIGNTLLIEGKTDSALMYYNTGLDIAKEYSIPAVQASILQNIGLTYQKRNEYEQAHRYLREAEKVCTTNISRAKILFNIGQLANKRQQTDSALSSLNKAASLLPDTSEYYLRGRIYGELASISERHGDYKAANNYMKQYTSSLKGAFRDNQSQIIYDIQKKYNYEVLKNGQQQLKIQRQYLIIISMAVIFALLVIAFILYVKLRKEQDTRKEAENNIINLEKMAKDFDKKENTFRNRLLDHFNILKKSALLSNMLNEEEKIKGKRLIRKFNEIVYHQDTLDWNIMYQAMNELHDGFLDYMREQYPQLDESEFRTCCLIYSDFTNEEIGVIMDLASSSITKKRSSIRRKLGIIDYGNIQDFLKNEMKIAKTICKKSDKPPGNKRINI